MMKYNLFLDDERHPQKAVLAKLVTKHIDLYNTGEWEIVRNYEDFIKIIEEKGLPNIVSFDHDLADITYNNGKMSFSYREKTGYDAAVWLANYCYDNGFKFPKYQVHSANPTGKENIERYLANAKKHLKI